MDVFDTVSPSTHRVDMKSKLTFYMAVAAVMILSISVNSAIATGAESDSDDRFNNIPGAGDCWQDGYNDGQEVTFETKSSCDVTENAIIVKIWQ